MVWRGRSTGRGGCFPHGLIAISNRRIPIFESSIRYEPIPKCRLRACDIQLANNSWSDSRVRASVLAEIDPNFLESRTLSTARI